MTEKELKAYFTCVKDGIWQYAWMKDGVYYVGTTGKTLQDAYKDVEAELQEQLDKLKS